MVSEKEKKRKRKKKQGDKEKMKERVRGEKNILVTWTYPVEELKGKGLVPT